MRNLNRNELSDRLDRISSRRQAILFLDDLIESLAMLTIENADSDRLLSAVSGFLMDFNEASEMSGDEYRRLCAILFESLFYE